MIFVVVVLSAGCRESSEQAVRVILDQDIASRSLRVGPETISLKLIDPFGKPVSGAHITLEGNMSHAGMTPVFASTSEVTPGSYRGSIQFTMPGDWIITVHARLADGQKVEQQFAVKGVRSD